MIYFILIIFCLLELALIVLMINICIANEYIIKKQDEAIIKLQKEAEEYRKCITG